jgi:Tol biopolymer transport system component
VKRSWSQRDVGSILGAVLCIAAATTSAFAQETVRVSVDSAGSEANAISAGPSLSTDGNVVAFISNSSNLVANDTNGGADVFVHERSTGITERVSVDSSGGEGNSFSSIAALSADGNVVAFFSDASNLVAGDTNGLYDVFVHDRTTGLTERVSIDSSGAQANGVSGLHGPPSVSADGRFVAFDSDATNLVANDTNGFTDVFVHDRRTGTTELVSVDSSGAPANSVSAWTSISVDGQIVAFNSDASNLVAGDTNGKWDIFVHDRATGTTERVSVRSNGSEANGDSGIPALSSDGRFVSFDGDASNLVVGDRNHCGDVFVHDRATGATERVSVDSSGAEGAKSSQFAAISGDGRFVTFSSLAANLVVGDTNGLCDIFVHDRASGLTERVSVDSAGAESDGESGDHDVPVISADGNVVAFGSAATNLVAGDTNGVVDVFAHERCSTPASWNNYGAGFPGTNGVPTFTSQQNPAFGATVTLDLANSYANPTAGVLFVGFQRTSLHSNWGGDLLVVPALTMFVTFSYGGDSFTGTIPDDRALCGVAVDLQAIEADPGAEKGVSFTAGLELVIGH